MILATFDILAKHLVSGVVLVLCSCEKYLCFVVYAFVSKPAPQILVSFCHLGLCFVIVDAVVEVLAGFLFGCLCFFIKLQIQK